ncbi:hypothetical protein GCM10009528_35380 [Kineococcus aurantiacus]
MSAVSAVSARSGPWRFLLGQGWFVTDEETSPAPAGAKGWADRRPWADVEHAVVRALTAVDAQLESGQDFALRLAYVPYSRQELRLAIVTWIEQTYHRRRRQQALGRLTPIEYETLLQATHAA